MQVSDEQQFAGPIEEKQKQLNNPLPISMPQFVLDDWKKEISNSPDKHDALLSLWEQFDEQRWSLWKITYLKDQGQGTLGLMTINLKNGMLMRLDKLRTNCFSSWGVYGAEGAYEIEGIWLFRGTEIPADWREQWDETCFLFEKLDPKNPAVWQLAAQYWLNRQKSALVGGRLVFDVSWFL